jgi:hypothetical protein
VQQVSTSGVNVSWLFIAEHSEPETATAMGLARDGWKLEHVDQEHLNNADVCDMSGEYADHGKTDAET